MGSAVLASPHPCYTGCRAVSWRGTSPLQSTRRAPWHSVLDRSLASDFVHRPDDRSQPLIARRGCSANVSRQRSCICAALMTTADVLIGLSTSFSAAVPGSLTPPARRPAHRSDRQDGHRLVCRRRNRDRDGDRDLELVARTGGRPRVFVPLAAASGWSVVMYLDVLASALALRAGMRCSIAIRPACPAACCRLAPRLSRHASGFW